MTTPRHLALALLFLGLIALEIGHGIFRLNAIREGRRREILSSIERGHSQLALEIRRRLEEEKEHAAYLARLPAVRDLLEAPAGDRSAWRSLQSNLLAYVLSFRRNDRVRVLDLEGCERFRCERIGQGVGSIPLDLLEREPDAPTALLTRGRAAGEVAISSLVIDQSRVEVSENDRQVIHFATAIQGGSERLGVLALTVYALPLLGAVRGFTPVQGVSSELIDGGGAYLSRLASSGRGTGAAPPSLRTEQPDLAERLLSGEERIVTAGAVFLNVPAGEAESTWRLLTHIPLRALDEGSGGLTGQYVWVIASMVGTAILLAAAGVFLVRMSLREVAYREAVRYRKHEKEMERQMQLSERLGSLGLLTAGVAHEINNPLEGIENYLALLDREEASPEQRRRYVDMVRYGFHRIRDIVRDLSSFARPSVGETQVDLAAVLRQALKMVGYTKDLKGVQIDLHGLESPRVVPGDAGRLEQVFINLFINAARAMKGSGRIAVRASSVSGEGRRPEVEVAVEDTGPGIPEEDLRKIFDPFFTTTEGTGLGLSVSYGIVRAHGGTIAAENRPEGGARFVLRLPAGDAAMAASRPGRTVA
ncbi:MAG TPA: ATP-binding protein [Planctomycetota bacterium]|nr:ATP-binding protein [Planctomycetota bacterium]